ncbi:potassium channel family protein [Streptomyces sp. SBT349]|uniref:potassium channel family protein n=1 Tax=Streptomyces sp. SBT349 TaxID=1580539 RepID=UPI00066A3B2E|nr:potassium channel family protein [Streptomyces sp. SBT349]
MGWWISVLGAVLIAAVLRDLFHTIWHPTRRAGIIHLVMAGFWRLSRRRSTRFPLLGLTGSLAMVVVVTGWSLTLVAGWTLVYWPHMPDGFTLSSEMESSGATDLLDSFYLSLVMISTLGLGDITPADTWLRLVTPLESLIGFLLLTAVVAWVLGIYPALARRRVAVSHLALLRRAGLTDPVLDSPGGAAILGNLARDLLCIHVDLSQYPETYYFHDSERGLESDATLSATVGYATDLARRGRAATRADVQLSGTLLAGALDELATVLDTHFLRTGGTTDEILTHYAAEHTPG